MCPGSDCSQIFESDESEAGPGVRQSVMLSVLRLSLRPARFVSAARFIPRRHSSRTHSMQHHRDTVPFSDVAAAGMARTVGALYVTREEPAIPSPSLSGARHHVLLVPGGAAPSLETGAYLQGLAQAAHAAAEAQGAGSVLAGQSSESDEFSDVAVYLAHPEGLKEDVPMEPGAILKELGLSKWGTDVSSDLIIQSSSVS
jgi:hypothetical protein